LRDSLPGQPVPAFPRNSLADLLDFVSGHLLSLINSSYNEILGIALKSAIISVRFLGLSGKNIEIRLDIGELICQENAFPYLEWLE
jgi:hypothetical protein